jgi:hypothetical protein
LAVVPPVDSASGSTSGSPSVDEVVSIAVALRGALYRVDASALSGAESARMTETLASLEKAVIAKRCEAALRAIDCGEHAKAGSHNAGDWLGRMLGVTRDAARMQLAAVEAAAHVPGLSSAVSSGSLSLPQAAEIARTEAEVPGSADSLMARARGASFKWLKDEARRIREAAAKPEDLVAKQKAAQRATLWKDALGMLRGSFAFAPLRGVGAVKRLRTEADRLFRAARRAGDDETTPEQFMAEALLRLIEGKGQGKAGTTEVVVVVDLRSLLLGEVAPGGTCHIIGGGRIPVSEAIRLAEGAFIKAVTHDGVNVQSAAHYGRRRKIPAVMASALRLGAPPLFHGVACKDGCACELGLQWDHIDPVANGGPTSMSNLDPKCTPGHKVKTEADWAAGLLGRKVSRRRRGEGRGPP